MDSYLAIENLIYTNAELIDAGKLDDVAQLFSHAEFVGPDGRIVASSADEFLAVQRQAVKHYEATGTPCTKHVASNVNIEVDEANETAKARSYFTVFQATEKLPLQPIIAGRYHDGFKRVEHIWRFCRRQSIPEFYGDLSQHLLFDIIDR